jgi:hypothetical protein
MLYEMLVRIASMFFSLAAKFAPKSLGVEFAGKAEDINDENIWICATFKPTRRGAMIGLGVLCGTKTDATCLANLRGYSLKKFELHSIAELKKSIFEEAKNASA